jgi:signal transduction histidine kinase
MTIHRNTKQPWRLDRLIYLPVLISIAIIAVLFIRTSLIQRETILERTKFQLDMMISTLADFNEFAAKTAHTASAKNAAQREALWKILLNYPAVKIWVESQDGKIIAGRALTGKSDSYIVTEAKRTKFNMYAAIAKDSVLTEWRNEQWGQLAIVIFIAIVFLSLTKLLSRALRQREQAQAVLADANRRAGMAQIAGDVLHNVGNALNSVNISVGFIANNIKQSKISALGKTAKLLRENLSDIENYLCTDERGKMLPKFIVEIYECLLEEQKNNLTQVEVLEKGVEHIKNIVARQQAYTGVSVIQEVVNLAELIEESIHLCGNVFKEADINLLREYESVPNIKLDKHKVLQIIVNLLMNAKNACEESSQKKKQILLRLTADNAHVILTVIDNGIGIAPENINKIFVYGFTTREKGHGYGLHNSIISAKEMGGNLFAQSNGLNDGASFTLVLPLNA